MKRKMKHEKKGRRTIADRDAEIERLYQLLNVRDGDLKAAEDRGRECKAELTQVLWQLTTQRKLIDLLYKAAYHP